MEKEQQSKQYHRFAEFARAPRGEDHKRHIKEALLGVPKPYIAEKQTSDEWKNIVRPLSLRNGTIAEIAELSGKTYKKISSQIHHKRKVYTIPEYFLPENKTKRRRRAGIRGGKTKNGQVETDNEVKIKSFAKIFIENNMFTEDLAFWDLAQKVANQNNKEWVDNFSFGLVAEVYLIAKYQEQRGKRGLMNIFKKTGESLGREWFYGYGMAKELRLMDRTIDLLMSSSPK